MAEYKMGFIGTGNMGSALARAAAKSGERMLLANRTPEKAEALLFGETAAIIQKWKESAAKNPEWAGDNPVEIHVSRDRDGRLAVSYSPQIL